MSAALERGLFEQSASMTVWQTARADILGALQLTCQEHLGPIGAQMPSWENSTIETTFGGQHE